MLTANGADGCGENMEIHQYNGKYVGGAIPYAYYDINIDEVTYIDAVLTGKWHMEDDRPDDVQNVIGFGEHLIVLFCWSVWREVSISGTNTPG